MAAKNYQLIKKSYYDMEKVISNAQNVNELLNMTFPSTQDEFVRIQSILETYNQKIAELQYKIKILESKVGK